MISISFNLKGKDYTDKAIMHKLDAIGTHSVRPMDKLSLEITTIGAIICLAEKKALSDKNLSIEGNIHFPAYVFHDPRERKCLTSSKYRFDRFYLNLTNLNSIEYLSESYY